MKLDKNYWAARYQTGDTPWDIGSISPQIKVYLDNIEDRSCRILIPGAGRAHEAAYLFGKGFTHVYVCDWAEEALAYLQKQVPAFPAENLICGDFFKMEGQYDLILEQTFFCAIQPENRGEYAQKTVELLRSGGEVAGLLFASHFPFDGPPFGGTEEEYRALFTPYFEIDTMKMATKSITPRQGNELFFQMRKK